MGVTATDDEVRCGSGGCWHEWTPEGPGDQFPAELADSVGLRQQACAARSLLDRRRVCAHVEVVGEEVRLVVQFDRSRWF